jgi:hypothetical protein
MVHGIECIAVPEMVTPTESDLTSSLLLSWRRRRIMPSNPVRRTWQVEDVFRLEISIDRPVDRFDEVER